MNSPFTQLYTNYITSVNKLVYDANLAVYKASHDFTKQAWQLTPMKDMFNFDFASKSDSKKSK